MAPHGTIPSRTRGRLVPRTDSVTAALAANEGKVPKTQREMQTVLRDTHVNAALGARLARFDEPDPKHGFKHPGYPHKSAATPPGCMTKCTVCAGQYFGPGQAAMLPYSRSFTDEEAAKQITELKTATANNLNYTRTFLDKHGTTIVKLWTKRSGNQRKEVIRQVMPDIAPRQGFVVDEILKRQKFSGGQRVIPTFAAKHHKGLLLPYLDMETLSQRPHDILALLYQRTRSKPADWLPYDSFQLDPMFRFPFLRTSYNPHCVQMHGGQYGQLVSWEKNAAHRLDVVGFPRAFLVFHAQHELSTLLRRFVDSIVAQPSATTVGGRDQLDTLASNGFMDEEDWARQNVHTGTSRSQPPDLNMENITDAFWTRFMAAEDELWLLQTDPMYLRNHFSRFEGAIISQDLNREEAMWYKSYISTMPLAIWESWFRLYVESEMTLNSLKASGGPVKCGKPLPEKYEVALASFERALREEFDAQSDDIMTIIMCANSFRQYYSGTQDDRIVINLLGKSVNETDPLFYQLIQLGNYDERTSYSAASHLRLLNHIVDSSNAQANRLDQLLINVLSSMTAIDEALTAIRLHRPRNRPFEQAEHSPHAHEFNGRTKMFSMSKVAQRKDLHLLCDTLEDFLRVHPLPIRMSKETLVIFDNSHKALQAFWEAVRRRWRSAPLGLAQKIGIGGHYADETLKVISFSTTKKYLEQTTTDRSALVDAIEAQECKTAAGRAAAAAKLGTSDAPPQKVWGHETPDTFRPLIEKFKSKTRPLQPARDESDQEDREVAGAAEAVKKLTLRIEVDTASYDIFQQMYDTSGEQQSDVRWKDFTVAMVDAGFSATPSGGSVFTFKNAENGGSINFHRPHPDPSINPLMLRVMGKRLDEWFNFDKDTFVERQKEEV
ncbi:hypothetical protein BST61_g4293 [Cercospora zeina]